MLWGRVFVLLKLLHHVEASKSGLRPFGVQNLHRDAVPVRCVGRSTKMRAMQDDPDREIRFSGNQLRAG